MHPQKQRKVTYRRVEDRECIPAIILEGKFLKGLGFHTGSQFSVEYSEGKIAIELLSESRENQLCLQLGGSK